MKRNFFTITLILLVVSGSIISCTKKLDLVPTNDITSATVYSTPTGYKLAFAKLYGSFALTGNQGPAGNGDVQGIDEGTSDFLRLFWKAQELSTDEAVVSWGDPGIQDFHNMNWSASNPMLTGVYYRSYYQITLCNDFINQSTDANLSSRGISGADADAIKVYREEARYLRAFQYWVLMDLFGNVPFVTENDALGSVLPSQINRADLFIYIETELKDLESKLVAARGNEYGRADQAAVWALLARLYLNAGVYTGTPRWTDAATYAAKVIGAGYTLTSDYRQLMLADNQLNKNEFIFTINYDGLKTQNWGGTTFLAHASVGGNMTASVYGLDGGWAGIRATKNLPLLFPDVNGTTDKRAQFFTSGQNMEINDLTQFTDGYAVTKYRNVTRSGAAGSSLTWVDIDFPVFRLPEMYLIYAEAVARDNAAGSIATATGYINALRGRAYGNTSGDISSAQLTPDFVLNERGRELYWEGFRRTDLIRFNKFTEGTYLWPWKGGVKSGTSVAGFRKLYPIPSADISSNTNLVQNPGY
ncbi:MAG: RagB/SusD family nutrient uptake outer membrane protein [Terrimonas sp.]|nr:RagB/SusD family nutrient uptake outer membrane protein [Terrimonas sp.]